MKNMCVFVCVQTIYILFWINTISAVQINQYFMEEGCGGTLSLAGLNTDSVRIKLTRNPVHRQNLDCTIAIEPPVGKELAIKVLDMDINNLNGQCGTDYLQLFDGRNNNVQMLQGTPQFLCNPRQLYSGSPETQRGYLIMRFQSRSAATRRGFEVLATAFKKGQCEQGFYQCDNGRCIPDYLRCSGFDHCGDNTLVCPLTKQALAGVSVAGGVVLIVLIALCVFCICRKHRNMKDEIAKERARKEGIYTVHGETIKIKKYPYSYDKPVANGHPSNGTV